jgi:hypothetical protein
MATIPTPEAGLVISYAYLLALAIIEVRARKRHRLSLRLSASEISVALKFGDNGLAIGARYSLSKPRAHIMRNRNLA